jgi:hypothetical protein
MNDVISLKDKKKEKIAKDINGAIQGFGDYVNAKTIERKDEILTFSDKLYDAVCKLKLNTGFDITISEVLDTKFILAFRYLSIAGNEAIVFGGYGNGFSIYDVDSIYSNGLSEDETKEQMGKSKEEHKKFLCTKIVRDFLQKYPSIKIVKINKKYDVF